MTRVKICGLTDLADAQCAAEAGADMLGFIFYPPSPRSIDPARAAQVVGAIRAAYGARAPRCVGVFVNESPARVRATAGEVGLDLVQLHGDESPVQVAGLGSLAYKAIRPRAAGEAIAQAARFAGLGGERWGPDLMVDAYHPDHYGGTGLPVDATVVAPLVRRWRILLAGGLTAATVGPVVAQLCPWGVDVASGVERAKGRKDHHLVVAFIRAVRAADHEMETDEG